jgi:hypothetical protein
MRRIELTRNNRSKTGRRQFRAFLGRDMAVHPERLSGPTGELLERARALTNSIEVDLEARIESEVALRSMLEIGREHTERRTAAADAERCPVPMADFLFTVQRSRAQPATRCGHLSTKKDIQALLPSSPRKRGSITGGFPLSRE